MSSFVKLFEVFAISLRCCLGNTKYLCVKNWRRCFNVGQLQKVVWLNDSQMWQTVLVFSRVVFLTTNNSKRLIFRAGFWSVQTVQPNGPANLRAATLPRYFAGHPYKAITKHLYQTGPRICKTGVSDFKTPLPFSTDIYDFIDFTIYTGVHSDDDGVVVSTSNSNRKQWYS